MNYTAYMNCDRTRTTAKGGDPFVLEVCVT